MATVMTTQYDRSSGSTSLKIEATRMHAISRRVNMYPTRPGPTSRSGRTAPAAREAADDEDSTRTAPASASRSAAVPAAESHTGGISGGAPPLSTHGASRPTTSMTSGGGRSPASASAVEASAI